MVDSTGHDAGDYSYSPFGKITNSLTSAAQSNPFRYVGSYQLPNSGYLHFSARYYDPNTTLRFTQADSVTGSAATPSTVDRYAYASGDPINNDDPTGHGAASTALNYAGDCASGAAIGLAIGAAGPDETGVGAAGAAVSGCAQGIIPDAATSLFGESVGEDVAAGSLGKTLSDIADVF